MGELAKVLIILGLVLVVAGLVLLFFQKVPLLGKLPGDIVIRRENFTLYFPLTTGILISIVISVILYLIGKLK